MGFETVYECLTNLFPEVDTRILRAVAIEHPKDPDDAAEAVLSEVLPYLSKQSAVSNSCVEEDRSAVDDGVENEEESYLQRRRRASLGKAKVSYEELTVMAENVACQNYTSSMHYAESTREVLPPSSTTAPSCAPVGESNQFQGDVEFLSLQPNSREEDIQSGSGCASGALLNPSVHEENTELPITDPIKIQSFLEKCLEINSNGNKKDTGAMPSILFQKSDVQSNSVDPIPDELDMMFAVETSLAESNIDGKSSEVKDSISEQAEEDTDDPIADDFDAVPSSPITSRANAVSSENGTSVIEDAQAAEEGGLHSDFPDQNQSDSDNKQEIEMELLEEIIESAKNNKKTLFSAMESVMQMITEVELEERAAEQAKEEAARGGSDILVQVEELKTMLAHAKEANDMHAGEIYGEKAILATEVRELQSRLLNLSDERDKTLAILDEMQQNLEARLAAAEELRRDAEQEKLEKEEYAQNALAEQEAIMEKVVQEAKILQEEAEKNSKLRDFLMDRGRVVDALQGEISVICKDVRLLKEKFDERVPLSESFSSSQTSCILASSGLSLKSKALGETLKNSTKTSPSSSIHGQSPERSPVERSPASSIYRQSPKMSSREKSPASSINGKSPMMSPREGSPASAIHGQSPNRSPRERSPSTSMDGQLPVRRLEGERISGTNLDDEWDFLENL